MDTFVGDPAGPRTTQSNIPYTCKLAEMHREPSPVQRDSGGSIAVLYHPIVQLHANAPGAEEIEYKGQGRQRELATLDLNSPGLHTAERRS